jgi:hypothetical protein
MKTTRYLLLYVLLLGLLGCTREEDVTPVSDAGEAAPPAVTTPAEPPTETQTTPPATGRDEPLEVVELEWDALVPSDWRPDSILADYDVAEFDDDDPRAKELMAKLEAAWKASPVVPDLDGRQVRLPGFVVPLEADAQRIAEFLLVPYYGACIHVPPPPANQTVHVITAPGAEFEGQLFDTVWVTGTLKVEASSSDLAEAGYRIEAVSVEPYEDG